MQAFSGYVTGSLGSTLIRAFTGSGDIQGMVDGARSRPIIQYEATSVTFLASQEC